MKTLHICLAICGRARCQETEATRKSFQYCTDQSGQEILYFRAFQGHSGRNPIDPSLQDNVFLPDNFFNYINHIGCAINSHSITNSGLIPGGQNLNNRQTTFLLAVDLMDKNHKDPDTIDFSDPRRAQYLHKVWKRHQCAVYWVDINLALKQGLKFHQTRSNAIILHETLPAYCIPKVVEMESGEIIYQKAYASPRPPPKISFKDNWMKELDSDVAGSSKDSQQIQPKSTTQLSRTERPVSEQPSDLLTQEIRKDVLFGRESTNSRTVRPVNVCQCLLNV